MKIAAKTKRLSFVLLISTIIITSFSLSGGSSEIQTIHSGDEPVGVEDNIDAPGDMNPKSAYVGVRLNHNGHAQTPFYMAMGGGGYYAVTYGSNIVLENGILLQEWFHIGWYDAFSVFHVGWDRLYGATWFTPQDAYTYDWLPTATIAINTWGMQGAVTIRIVTDYGVDYSTYMNLNSYIGYYVPAYNSGLETGHYFVSVTYPYGYLTGDSPKTISYDVYLSAGQSWVLTPSNYIADYSPSSTINRLKTPSGSWVSSGFSGYSYSTTRPALDYSAADDIGLRGVEFNYDGVWQTPISRTGATDYTFSENVGTSPPYGWSGGTIVEEISGNLHVNYLAENVASTNSWPATSSGTVEFDAYLDEGGLYVYLTSASATVIFLNFRANSVYLGTFGNYLTSYTKDTWIHIILQWAAPNVYYVGLGASWFGPYTTVDLYTNPPQTLSFWSWEYNKPFGAPPSVNYIDNVRTPIDDGIGNVNGISFRDIRYLYSTYEWLMLRTGLHTISFRSYDSLGLYSPTQSFTFYKDTMVLTPLSPVYSIEDDELLTIHPSITGGDSPYTYKWTLTYPFAIPETYYISTKNIDNFDIHSLVGNRRVIGDIQVLFEVWDANSMYESSTTIFRITDDDTTAPTIGEIDNVVYSGLSGGTVGLSFDIHLSDVSGLGTATVRLYRKSDNLLMHTYMNGDVPGHVTSYTATMSGYNIAIGVLYYVNISVSDYDGDSLGDSLTSYYKSSDLGYPSMNIVSWDPLMGFGSEKYGITVNVFLPSIYTDYYLHAVVEEVGDLDGDGVSGELYSTETVIGPFSAGTYTNVFVNVDILFKGAVGNQTPVSGSGYNIRIWMGDGGSTVFLTDTRSVELYWFGKVMEYTETETEWTVQMLWDHELISRPGHNYLACLRYFYWDSVDQILYTVEDTSFNSMETSLVIGESATPGTITVTLERSVWRRLTPSGYDANSWFGNIAEGFYLAAYISTDDSADYWLQRL